MISEQWCGVYTLASFLLGLVTGALLMLHAANEKKRGTR